MAIEPVKSGGLVLEPAEGEKIGPIRIDRERSLILGRDQECDVTLSDMAVSHVHATIQSRGREWVVTDHESRNGTYVNGMRIEPAEPTVLHDHDVLRIKPWSFVTRIEGSEREKENPDEGESATEQQEDAPPPDAPDLVDRGTHATRATIFLRLKSSDPRRRELSWEEFADRYGPVVIGYVRNAGLRRQEADDILQQVLLGFFRVSGSFQYDPAKGRFRGYLKRATLNAVREWHRRNRPNVPLESGTQLADPRTTAVTWDHEWSKQVFRRALAETTRQFSAQTNEAFDLYGRRGVPADVVAERLGMSEESVRQAKSRVMKAVSERIRELRDAEG